MFHIKNVATLKRAFTTYVRPLLEYASCVLSPSYCTVVRQIESVQRQFTKRLPGCHQLNYKCRLARLSMDNLELRRLHSDLILVYKILFGLVDVIANDFFSLNQSSYSTRGHNYKLCKNHCRVNIRQHFFTDRVVQPWNSMITSPQDFSSINMFKRCLKKNDLSKFLNN